MLYQAHYTGRCETEHAKVTEKHCLINLRISEENLKIKVILGKEL
jgi:tyrosine-protein phosphatase YwqE